MAWAASARAQIAVDWLTIDCGGETSAADGVMVSGTIGQFDAGPTTGPMIGGGFADLGGFWVVTLLCPADFNQSGAVSVQDIFDFLAAYFSNDPRSDFNLSGTISVQDIFDFLAAYFTGC
jgi:hypothetical protein